MKKSILIALTAVLCFGSAGAQSTSNSIQMKELSAKSYTTFKVSNKVTLYAVSFKNQYDLQVAGHLFVPKNLDRKTKNAAIIVGHPMGAVKEQSADVYASNMADRGFIAMAIDLSFWGESEGSPRNAVLPDMYAEDFSAAVDFLGTRDFVDRERIGVLGVCGSGSFVISAAKIDPRMKAIATVSMYDMGSVNRNGFNKSQTLVQRKQVIAAAAEQRYSDFLGGKPNYGNYLPEKLPADADTIRKEFYDFYRTKRGIHISGGRTLMETENRTNSAEVKFMNFYPFDDIETISPRPMLFITGSNAHSREFSFDAYKRAAEPKELVVIPNAGHVDLYDRTDLIPFDKLEAFFKTNLK